MSEIRSLAFLVKFYVVGRHSLPSSQGFRKHSRRRGHCPLRLYLFFYNDYLPALSIVVYEPSVYSDTTVRTYIHFLPE